MFTDTGQHDQVALEHTRARRAKELKFLPSALQESEWAARCKFIGYVSCCIPISDNKEGERVRTLVVLKVVLLANDNHLSNRGKTGSIRLPNEESCGMKKPTELEWAC